MVYLLAACLLTAAYGIRVGQVLLAQRLVEEILRNGRIAVAYVAGNREYGLWHGYRKNGTGRCCFWTAAQ